MRKYFQILLIVLAQNGYHAASQAISNLSFKKNNFNNKTVDANSDFQNISSPIQKPKGFPLDTLPQKFTSDILRHSSSAKQKLLTSVGENLYLYKKDFEYMSSVWRKPIQLMKTTIDILGYVDSSYLLSRTSSAYFAMMNVNTEWIIGGIPMIINDRNQYSSDFGKSTFNVSLQFDKDNYLNMLRQRMNKYDPVKFLKLPGELAQRLAEQAKSSLHAELDVLEHKYGGLLLKEVSSVKGISNIESLDLKSLRRQFLNADFIKMALEKERLLGLLQEKVNAGASVDLEQLKTLQQSVLKFKALQDLIVKIELHQRRWESSGLLKKIKDAGLLRNDKIMRLIKDPSTVRKMAKEYLSLQGFEKMFLNINKLNLGQNSLTLSTMSFRSFLSNGITTEFLNKGKSILALFGKQKENNSILDYQFDRNLFSANNFATAARIQLNKSSASSSHLSLSSFSQALTNSFLPSVQTELRKIMVTSFSNDLTIGQNGLLSMELSRSASQYHTSSRSTDSTLAEKSPISTIFSGENLFANSAISFKYADALKDKGLTYQLNFSRVSNGYTNPGNSFLSSGSSEWGVNARKTFAKNRLQLSFQTNRRGFSFGMGNNQKWVSSSNSIHARWKMKKGQYISVRYQPVKMSKIRFESRARISSMERLTVDANLAYRFNKTLYRNLVSVSYQGSSYEQASTMLKTSTVAINSYQSINFRKNVLFVNSTLNKANNRSGFIYLNTSAIFEGGYSCQLFKTLSVSSGFFYNKVSGWYEQIGIRESLNGQLGKNVSINLYVDAGKNISVSQQLWNHPVRADLAIRYCFENRK